jgi:hypothetical protein
MRKISTILGAFLLTAAWAASVGATQPFFDTFVVEDDFDLVNCGSYDVNVAATIRITEKLSFNRDGEPIRVQVQLKVLESRFYNSTDNSLFINQGKNGVGENVSGSINFVTGAERWSGAEFRLTIPGIGHVLMEIGTWKYDEYGNLTRHGQSALAEGDTGLALCEALAP